MTAQDDFERAFVATAFVLGRRGRVAEGLAGAGRAAEACERRLDRSTQAERARALATELKPVLIALEARRIA